MNPTAKHINHNHLGSANVITTPTALPVQFMLHLPYGEEFVKQLNSTYDERFTFTGKEKDIETGYYYFGARFDNVDLGFMSVDPMSDKYPSISPYAYCAWNPVKYVDPAGEEVYIVGDGADQATLQLSSRGIKITRDSETGILSYTLTGKKLSKRESSLITAIDSKNVRVNINATNLYEVPFEEGYSLRNSLCGQFLGVSLGENCNPKGLRETAETRQLVNPNICRKTDEMHGVPSGTSLVHEITESYIAGIICLDKKNQFSIGPCWSIAELPNHIYWEAHKRA